MRDRGWRLAAFWLSAGMCVSAAVAQGLPAAGASGACAGSGQSASGQSAAGQNGAGVAERCVGLAGQIEAMTQEPGVARAHWGVLVADLDGTRIFGLNEGQFFQPASNTKLFTTAAAMALLGPETTFETRVEGRGEFTRGGSRLKGDLVLVGGGDANLSGREVPYVAPALRTNPAPRAAAGAPKPPEPDPLRYLAAMADEVAATGLKVVDGDVVGDDTLFAWEPYPQDWSIDDAVWGYGAPVSALTVADNQMQLTVTPGSRAGKAASVVLEQGAPYYTLQADVLTVPAKSADTGVQVERAPGSRVLRVYGRIAADAQADVEEVAIQDPAEYAAMALKAMLEERGVKVSGTVRAQHRMPEDWRGFLSQLRKPTPAEDDVVRGMGAAAGGACAAEHGKVDARPAKTLATRRSVPLGEDVAVTNKVSQNLHAELLLRHLGRKVPCTGGRVIEGARLVRSFLLQAGLDADDFVFYDGSGLSGHDLLTPRATVRLLTWASTQPWFAAWKASLPVGGEDGSLVTRFGKSTLKGHLQAKTGTLSEARALSGYVEAASGRTVAFSVMVTDHAPGGHADQDVMDRMVEAIAAAN